MSGLLSKALDKILHHAEKDGKLLNRRPSRLLGRTQTPTPGPSPTTVFPSRVPSTISRKESKKTAKDEFTINHTVTRAESILHDGVETLVWNEKRKLMVANLSMGMQALMLIHAPVSRKVFQYFDCDRIGSEDWSQSYLRADYSIPCSVGYSVLPSYVAFLPVVLIVFTTFTAALPILLTGYFFAKRNKLYTPVVLIRIGWMYRRMPRGVEFWEIFELMRKMTLTGLIVFFPNHPVVRACFCLLICFFSSGCLNYFRPHKNNLVFWVEQMGYTAALLLFIAGIIFSESVELDEREQNTVAFITIGIFMVFAVCSFVAIVLTLYMVQKNIEVESKRRSTVVVRPKSRPSAAGYMKLMSGKAIKKRQADIAAGIAPVAAQKRDAQSICKEEEEQILLKSLTNSQEAINNHDSHAAIDSILGLIEVDEEKGPAKDDDDADEEDWSVPDLEMEDLAKQMKEFSDNIIGLDDK